MSQFMSAPTPLDRPQLDRLCTAIRGKLQFLDYLVRAAIDDAERYEAENDIGTRIFLRQLIEMHAASLATEGDSMREIAELCERLETFLHSEPAPSLVPVAAASASLRNGDAA